MDENAAYKKMAAVNGVYLMSEGDSATVYGISKYTYTTKDFPDVKETTKLYKILFNGKVCYVTDQGHIPFTYYSGNKYSKKVTSKTKKLWIYDTAAMSHTTLPHVHIRFCPLQKHHFPNQDAPGYDPPDEISFYP